MAWRNLRMIEGNNVRHNTEVCGRMQTLDISRAHEAERLKNRQRRDNEGMRSLY